MEQTQKERRRLAAIMFSDMVGFSALTQADEAKALKLLAEHNAIFREALPKHEGREVKSTGDGFLLEFPSALTAVQCAIEVQQTIHDRNLIEEDKIGIRVGIHLGDVVTRDGDIFGDGVNIAARIEPLAETGGICVTSAVAQQIQNKVGRAVGQVGFKTLKNIDDPVEIFKIYMPWDQGLKRKWKKKTLLLGAVPAVVIAAAIYFFGFAGETVPPLTEAQILTKTARELVSGPAVNREHWANATDLSRQATELDPMDGVAYAVAAQIMYQMMREYRNVTPEKLEQAKTFVARSQQFAPKSVETGLAVILQMLYEEDVRTKQWLFSLRETFPDEPRIPEALAIQALVEPGELESKLADFERWREVSNGMGGSQARMLQELARFHYMESRFPEALQAVQISLKSGGLAGAIQWKLIILSTGLGDLDAAEEALQDLQGLVGETLRGDRTAFYSNIVWSWTGQHAKAIEYLENWTRPFIEQGGQAVPTDYLRGLAYERQGLDGVAQRAYEAALSAVDLRLEDLPNDPRYVTYRAILLLKTGREAEGQEVGRAAKQIWGRTHTLLDMNLGNYDEVLDAMEERIVERGEFGLLQYTEARYDPYFDPIRDDPRFIEIMKVGAEWMAEENARGDTF
jgi:class 3 adenylate cyclase